MSTDPNGIYWVPEPQLDTQGNFYYWEGYETQGAADVQSPPFAIPLSASNLLDSQVVLPADTCIHQETIHKQSGSLLRSTSLGMMATQSRIYNCPRVYSCNTQVTRIPVRNQAEMIQIPPRTSLQFPVISIQMRGRVKVSFLPTYCVTYEKELAVSTFTRLGLGTFNATCLSGEWSDPV